LLVLAVSDTVNKNLYSTQIRELAGNVDLIISCGDLPAFYLDYLASSLLKPLLYVCGNHDHYEEDDGDLDIYGNTNVAKYISRKNRYKSFGGRNLDERIERIGKVSFAGLEGSFLYNRGAHQYTEFQMNWKIWHLKPRLYLNRIVTGRYLDVLVTHAPPYGVHDQTDRAHRGFKAFIKFIRKYKPKYLLHGHTHIYNFKENRILDFEGTKIVNCYDYVFLDIKP